MDTKKYHDALDTLKDLPAAILALSKRIDKQDAFLSTLNQVSAPPPQVPGPSPTLTLPDQLYPLGKCGVNIPWCQFGNDIVGMLLWQHKSLANDADKRYRLHELFSVAKGEGFSTVRFWLMPSLWHGGGVYTRAMIDEASASVQILCNIARHEGVQLIPTLFSFDNYSKDKTKYGAVPPMSHRTHIQLVNGIVSALAGNSDVIDYVDIMNECEWALKGIPNADPEDSLNTVTLQAMRHVLEPVARIIRNTGLVVGYGSASLKWSDTEVIAGTKDFHAYEGWSTEYFPPESIDDGSGYVMGETDIPYSGWGDLFSRGKYRKVLLWLEPEDYSTPDKLREVLREFKST